MKVVILCGGMGTRIRDVADNIPKPMIPIGDKPILWHIMKYYSSFNYNEFILCLGYKSEVIKDFFINYETRTRDFTIDFSKEKRFDFHNAHDENNWKVTLAETGLDSLTGTRVLKIKKYIPIEDNEFMLTYGDGVGDIDLNSLLKFHRSHNKILTITGVRPPGRFGELMKDDYGNVIEFNEKPQSVTGLISGGFFVCKKEIFDYIPADKNIMFEDIPMKNLVKDNQVCVFEHNGFWQPMDTYREYKLLNELYENKKAPWVIW